MANTEAREHLEGRSIRFLFIDGDHTKEGVKKDVGLFFHFFEGSIIVFDDYFKGFQGLIEAIDDVFEEYEFDRAYYHEHTLVLKL